MSVSHEKSNIWNSGSFITALGEAHYSLAAVHSLDFFLSREMTPVRRGDVVHLEGHSEGASWVVDREQGFLVLLPDSLISGTSISSSIRCMRRAVLGDMFKVKSFTNTITITPCLFMLVGCFVDCFTGLRLMLVHSVTLYCAAFISF